MKNEKKEKTEKKQNSGDGFSPEEISEFLKKAQERPEELAELMKKAGERDEYYNKWLSVHAEYDNVSRRMEKEKSDNIRFANETLIMRLFPIMDNFDMAIGAMDKAEDKDAVLEGIKMVQKQFHAVLEECGVKKISSEGEDFDPEIHEAFGVEKTADAEENTVIKELRSGYKLNDRLIRPAQVIVAQNPEGDEGSPEKE